VTRNVGAKWVVASENEWYKAAYYDPLKTSGAGGYWLHATKSDSLGDNKAFTATKGANCTDGDFVNGGFSGPGSTDVGAYVNAASAYGTFDQGGNLMEWTESVCGHCCEVNLHRESKEWIESTSASGREVRGGSWLLPECELRSSCQRNVAATHEGSNIGFRVASLDAIPKN
jgi:formylglycine-generating enzyme required for sulfatase activity